MRVHPHPYKINTLKYNKEFFKKKLGGKWRISADQESGDKTDVNSRTENIADMKNLGNMLTAEQAQ